MRHRVEENERASAAEVAHAIDTAVADTNADLLVLAGETQSRSRVRRALGHRAGEIVQEAEAGGRAAGADRDELDREVARIVDGTASAARRAAAERYERLAGQDEGRAVDGVGPVTEAFRAAQVDALYLDADQLSRRPLWIGPEPGQLATRREDLAALHIEAKGPVAAADALLRAAAGTGASLHPVGGGRTGLAGRPLAEGVGAVLRTGRADSTSEG